MGIVGDFIVALCFHLCIFGFVWFFIVRPLSAMQDWEPPAYEEKENADIEEDYWDGETIDYGTGEVRTNTGPTVRHPKNRDRAHQGGAKRFDDGRG